jgi:chaperonin cofactor prefoldin
MDNEKKARKTKRDKLEQELGQLTYARAKLERQLNENARRSNEIGTILEGMDGE